MATVSPTWQDKLKTYSTNTAAAQAEIARAKDVYAKATTAAAKTAASKWADQVRAASGISVNDATYGNNKATFGKPVAPAVPAVPAYDPEAEARAYAESQANAKYNASKDAITAMMDRLQKQRESSIKSAEMGAEASRQGLEASAFKANRQAQQAMAGRGLVGTGIAADVGARQGMAKQAELSALYGNLNKATADINTQADLSNAELNQELKTLEANKGSMTEEMYQNQLDRLMTREANQAQFTGKYMGQDTMATKQQNLQNLWATANATGVISKELAALTGLKAGSKTLEATNSEASRNIALAQVTGKITYTDPTTGKTVTADTQSAKETAVNSLMKQAELTGVIGADLAKIIGVPAGTPTLTAKKYADDAAIARAKASASGTSTTFDSNNFYQNAVSSINNAYDSVDTKDKTPEQIKKDRVAAARTIFESAVSTINGDPTVSAEQKKAMIDQLIKGGKGVDKQAKAWAYDTIGITSKTSANTNGTNKTTTENQTKLGSETNFNAKYNNSDSATRMKMESAQSKVSSTQKDVNKAQTNVDDAQRVLDAYEKQRQDMIKKGMKPSQMSGITSMIARQTGTVKVAKSKLKTAESSYSTAVKNYNKYTK